MDLVFEHQVAGEVRLFFSYRLRNITSQVREKSYLVDNVSPVHEVHGQSYSEIRLGSMLERVGL
jgi:hypothetical protein